MPTNTSTQIDCIIYESVLRHLEYYQLKRRYPTIDLFPLMQFKITFEKKKRNCCGHLEQFNETVIPDGV